MRRTILIIAFLLALSGASMAQAELASKGEPTEADKTAAIPTESYLKRGAPIGTSEKVELNAILKDPAKFAEKSVLVEGMVVRSCKMEGCWAEVAQDKDSKSVRVKMKDHSF